MLKECWCEKWFVYSAIKLDLLKLMGPKNCVVESRAHRALIQTTLYLFNCGKHNFLPSYKFITPFVDSEPSEHILSMLVFNTRENNQAR